MCIGVPMQVLEPGDGVALCDGIEGRQQVLMELVGDQPVGTWVLTHLGAARELLTEDAAHKINDAIRAVNLVMQGETNVDHLFADLIDREPEPPPSMLAAQRQSKT